MSDHDSSRPVRPFLASHDVADEVADKTDTPQVAGEAAESSDFAAILPASELEKRQASSVKRQEDEDRRLASSVKGEEDEGKRQATSDERQEFVSKRPATGDGRRDEIVASSPVKVVEGERQATSDERQVEEPAGLAEKIDRSKVEAVGAPMAHYDRKEQPVASSLSASEIAMGGRRSGSTKKARVSAGAGLLAVLAVAVGVYVANDGIYSLTGPDGTVASNPSSTNVAGTNQTPDPSTLAAVVGTKELTLSGRHFENLKEGHYQLWLEQAGTVSSLGVFSLGEAGQVVDKDGKTFSATVTLANNPATLFVTIESGSEAKTKPSSTVLMTGVITGENSNLSFEAVDVSKVSGVYTLATPTDLSDDNPLSGIWLAKTDGQTLTGPGLTLPKAPAGWAYEGQMIYKNQIIAMGRFASASGQDDFQRFTPNPDRIPNWPGEDYLQGAPSRLGLDFPTNLADGDWKILITLEPDNNGVDPSGDETFFLHLLEAAIDKDSEPYTEYSLKNVAKDLPTLTVNLR